MWVPKAPLLQKAPSRPYAFRAFSAQSNDKSPVPRPVGPGYYISRLRRLRLPRDPSTDTLIFLGDLIDRGPDVPGCVEHVLNLCQENPEKVICLRGNHEQMLLDFIDAASLIWMSTGTGSDQTFRQYTETPIQLRTDADFDRARELIKEKFPAHQ